MTISYTKLGRRVFPSTATLNSQSPPPSQTTTPRSASPRTLLSYYQRSTFAAPQGGDLPADEPAASAQERLRGVPSLAATRASPFSRPSTAQPPQRSSPSMASRSCPHPEQEATTAGHGYPQPRDQLRLRGERRTAGDRHADPSTPSARSADAAELSARRSPCSSARSTPARTGGLPPQRRGEGFS